jgi:hypothetical protein
MECGKRYLIIYDDKGFKPVKKEGIIKRIDGNLIELEGGQILNQNYIIRAQLLDGGNCGKNGKT